MQGGGQQSFGQQSYNMGNSMQGGGAQAMQMPVQPSFMSQPNYGYQNPYANIFANLSQQQAQLPQAPIAMPSAPAASNAPAAFDQTANNLAAGLPAAGQAPPAPASGASNPLIVPSTLTPPPVAPPIQDTGALEAVPNGSPAQIEAMRRIYGRGGSNY